MDKIVNDITLSVQVQPTIGGSVSSSALGGAMRMNAGAMDSWTFEVVEEEGAANSVPAAAVIQRPRALFGFTGRKGCVGGRVSLT